MKKNNFRRFFITIILPTILAICLFIISIFQIIIPAFEEGIVEKKQEMIKELTNSTWSVLAKYEQDEKDSILTREEAQQKAISRIEYLRYGNENKDYFWITDMHPNMIMHPYREDLVGNDLSDFEDAHGKKLFVEFVKTVEVNDDGYVNYMWQWKDDSTRIVPKLSYVKRFEPWDWVIGTGIYVEDVREEIANMEDRIINISLIIIISISILLLIITLQSLKLEKRRYNAENDLKVSREKYKKLVESSSEGTLMVLDGNIIYSNIIIRDILGYTEEELSKIYFINLLTEEEKENPCGIRIFSELDGTKRTDVICNSGLIKKDGSIFEAELSSSLTDISDKKGYIIKIREVSSDSKEFVKQKTKFKSLTDNIKIGVFRTTMERVGKIIEANPATLNILGYTSETELYNTNILDLFHTKEDRKEFINDLVNKGSVKNKIIKLSRKDAILKTIAVSAVVVRDEYGNDRYCDGVIEDITEQKEIEEKRENLITELQTSLLFLNKPIKDYLKNLQVCDMHDSLKKVATIMSKNNYNAILVTTNNGEDTIGIITDHDIRVRAVAKTLDLNEHAFQIMSSPLLSISDRALLYEAVVLMNENDISHLAIKDIHGKISSIVSKEELLQLQRYSPSFLVREIKEATEIDIIKQCYDRVPIIIRTLIESGANAWNITRITSNISEAIINKLLDLAIKELGVPPAKFSYIVLGSVGREEQTLATDQDNAIIYDDVDESKAEETQKYFLQLGELVSKWLNEVGYTYCIGEIMAKNPKWCKPISQWKSYFTKWITTKDPQSLIDINIFFDFNTAYGEERFADELRGHVNSLIKVHPLFLIHLTNKIITYKPPIGIFGKIVVGTSKEKPETFNIKQAIMPIVDIARIYSLNNNILETNTTSRLNVLFENGFINKSFHKEIIEAYHYLMQLRLKHQALQISQSINPDNYINPKKLTNIEQVMLKKVFTQLNDFMTKLSYDFKGTSS